MDQLVMNQGMMKYSLVHHERLVKSKTNDSLPQLGCQHSFANLLIGQRTGPTSCKVNSSDEEYIYIHIH